MVNGISVFGLSQVKKFKKLISAFLTAREKYISKKNYFFSFPDSWLSRNSFLRMCFLDKKKLGITLGIN